MASRSGAGEIARAVAVWLVGLSVLVSATFAHAGKIAPALAARLATGEKVATLVLFRRRAPLAALSGAGNRAARGRAVVDALREAADVDQRGARGLLAGRGASIQSYFVVNAMRVVAEAKT